VSTGQVVLIAFLPGVVGLLALWAFTAVRWFNQDWRVRPLRLRIWRAVMWFPLMVWFAPRDFLVGRREG